MSEPTNCHKCGAKPGSPHEHYCIYNFAGMSAGRGFTLPPEAASMEFAENLRKDIANMARGPWVALPAGQTVKTMTAGETIYPGEAVYIDDGLIRLTDREEAARRKATEVDEREQAFVPRRMLAMMPLPKGSAIFDDMRVVGIAARDIAVNEQFTYMRGANTDDVLVVGSFIAPTTILNAGKPWVPDNLPDESVTAQSSSAPTAAKS